MAIARYPSGKLKYYQSSIIRKNIRDTIWLDSKLSQVIVRWTDAYSKTEKIVHGEYNGYTFLWINHGNEVSIMGDAKDSDISNLHRLILNEFDEFFIPLNVELENFEIKRLDVAASDTLFLTKRAKEVLLRSGNTVKRIEFNSYLDLRRKIEELGAWTFTDNMEYSKKYPAEFRFSIKSDDRENSWSVFGPTYVSDRRYFEILSTFENLTKQ